MKEFEEEQREKEIRVMEERRSIQEEEYRRKRIRDSDMRGRPSLKNL